MTSFFVTYETGVSKAVPKIISLFWHIKFDFFVKIEISSSINF